MSPLRRLIAAVAMTLAAFSARADFNDGVVAYLMGDYQTAYNTMRALAETADHGYAQYYVGMMYLNGQGVTQSYEDAGQWFLKAAEHSIPQAQYKLGLLYSNGQGLPRDYERAYAWYKAGAAHNHPRSVEALDDARTRLSAAELVEAEKLATKFASEYGPKEDAGQPVQIKNE